jgi:hypothetical protein
MRHFLLALLIALLPLRGWMGDAMALAQLAPPASHSTSQAAPVHAGHSAPGADTRSAEAILALLHPCEEHAGHAGHAPPGLSSEAAPTPAEASVGHAEHPGATPGDTASASQAPHPTHQHKTCDVCNGPALALDGVGAAGPVQPLGVLASSTVRFVSTVLPQGIKPPIS